jgi:hypothetical protein
MHKWLAANIAIETDGKFTAKEERWNTGGARRTIFS